MNDIEILRAIQKQKPFIVWLDDKPYNKSVAIENLIKENKELKEEVLHWKGKYHLENRKYIQLHNEKIDAPVIEATEEMLKQYIAKSKVKEKIEHYNKMINATYGDMTVYADFRRDTCIEIKQILQELLEEGDK